MTELEPDVASGRLSEERSSLTAKRAWFDLAVIASILVVPALSVLLYDYQALAETLPFETDMVTLAVQSLSVIAVSCYIAWTSGLGWSWHGVVRFQPVKDLLLSVAIIVLFFFNWAIVDYMASVVEGMLGVERYGEFSFVKFGGGTDWVFMLAAFTLNSLSEEGAIRVIAVSRLGAIIRSPFLAILLANLAFGAYHLYQGVVAAIGVFTFGLILSTFFALRRSIWPLVIAHTAINVLVTLSAR